MLCDAYVVDTNSLQKLLSPGSYIGNVTAPRWSDYEAPLPGAVVHPVSEQDVQTTVKWAAERNIPLLARGGGNGWATTFTIDKRGIVIDLDQLRNVTFSADKKLVTVGGGALISDLTTACQNDTLVATGTCDCVGVLGALLGGGIGRLTGEYGLGVDNVVSMNVVLADGTFQTVTAESSPDLFWALRGAAPNFGIVTSAMLMAYPTDSNNPATAWVGALIYTPEQLDPVLSAIANLTLTSHMALSMTWVLGDNGTPSIIVSVFYHGAEKAGRAAFASLLSIGPVRDGTAITPYAGWNAGSAAACAKGGRKPTWGVGMSHLDLASWHAVYDVWAELVQQTGTERSSMLLTAYPMDKARELPVSTSAYPFRGTVSYFATFTALYTDPAFDAEALSYGMRARALWQSADGLAHHSTYINNGFGDENLRTIYGDSLPRLQTIKRKYDPHCRFNQWFPIS